MYVCEDTPLLYHLHVGNCRSVTFVDACQKLASILRKYSINIGVSAEMIVDPWV